MKTLSQFRYEVDQIDSLNAKIASDETALEVLSEMGASTVYRKAALAVLMAEARLRMDDFAREWAEFQSRSP